MGLLKHLLFWPVTGPSFLTRFALGKVGDTVREELTNDAAIKEDLLALQMQLELGEIDDDQYVEQEAMLMQRLREVRQWREEFGMGTSGGPVRVATSAPEGREATPAEPLPVTESTRFDEEQEDSPRGGIASPGGASVEVRFDWE